MVAIICPRCKGRSEKTPAKSSRPFSLIHLNPRGCDMTLLLQERQERGCTTYKWKLSRPAFLPVVFKLAIQMAAAECQDRVGSSNGPEHSRPFETESDHRLATSF